MKYLLLKILIKLLQKKVNKLEEEQNEIKMREKKYGKNLDMTSIKLKKNKNKKIQQMILQFHLQLLMLILKIHKIKILPQL